MRVGAILFALLAGCGVELEHGLDERQANQVATLLGTQGIEADKLGEEGQTGSYKIVVPRGDASRAFALLEAHDLPRRGQRGLADTFAQSGLLPSPTEDRARYAAALSAELERTLEGVPGVAAARVHLGLTSEETLGGDLARARPTASVLLKGRPTIAEAEVRKLVAGAVHDLQPADVTVVVAPRADEPSTPPYDRVGPLRVAHQSRPLAAALAAGGLGVILLLAVVLLFAAVRLGRLQRRVRELEKR
jgi:type III secretion protein J